MVLQLYTCIHMYCIAETDWADARKAKPRAIRSFLWCWDGWLSFTRYHGMGRTDSLHGAIEPCTWAQSCAAGGSIKRVLASCWQGMCVVAWTKPSCHRATCGCHLSFVVLFCWFDKWHLQLNLDCWAINFRVGYVDISLVPIRKLLWHQARRRLHRSNTTGGQHDQMQPSTYTRYISKKIYIRRRRTTYSRPTPGLPTSSGKATVAFFHPTRHFLLDQGASKRTTPTNRSRLEESKAST